MAEVTGSGDSASKKAAQEAAAELDKKNGEFITTGTQFKIRSEESSMWRQVIGDVKRGLDPK